MFQKPPQKTLQEYVKSLRIEYTKPERGQGSNEEGGSECLVLLRVRFLSTVMVTSFCQYINHMRFFRVSE